jgi:transposase-like protein
MGQKKYTEDFKRKVGEAAAKGEKTFKQLSEEFGVHTTLVSNWKKGFKLGKFDNLEKKRSKYTEDFKKQVGEAAVKGEKTLKLLSDEFGVHTTLISNWKKDFLSGKFENKSKTAKSDNKVVSGEQSSILKKLCDRLGYDKLYREKHGSDLSYYTFEIKGLIDEFYYDEEDEALMEDLEGLCSELEDLVSKADIANIGELAVAVKIFESLGLYPDGLLEKPLELATTWRETIEMFEEVSKSVDYNSEKSKESFINTVVGLMFVGIEHAIEEGDEDGINTWIYAIGLNERYDDGCGFFPEIIDGMTDSTQGFLEEFYDVDYDDDDNRNFEDGTTNWDGVVEHFRRMM